MTTPGPSRHITALAVGMVMLLVACSGGGTQPSGAKDGAGSEVPASTAATNAAPVEDGPTAGGGSLSNDEIDALLDAEGADELLAPLLALGFGDDEARCVMATALRDGLDVLGEIDRELVDLMVGCGVSLSELAAAGLGVPETELVNQLETLAATINPELQTALRASEESRVAMAGLFSAQGLDEAIAMCLVEEIATIEDLAVLEDLNATIEIFLGCGITLDDLEGMG